MYNLNDYKRSYSTFDSAIPRQPRSHSEYNEESQSEIKDRDRWTGADFSSTDYNFNNARSFATGFSQKNEEVPFGSMPPKSKTSVNWMDSKPGDFGSRRKKTSTLNLHTSNPLTDTPTKEATNNTSNYQSRLELRKTYTSNNVISSNTANIFDSKRDVSNYFLINLSY